MAWGRWPSCWASLRWRLLPCWWLWCSGDSHRLWCWVAWTLLFAALSAGAIWQMRRLSRASAGLLAATLAELEADREDDAQEQGMTPLPPEADLAPASCCCNSAARCCEKVGCSTGRTLAPVNQAGQQGTKGGRWLRQHPLLVGRRLPPCWFWRPQGAVSLLSRGWGLWKNLATGGTVGVALDGAGGGSPDV